MTYSEGTEEPFDFYLKVPWPYRVYLAGVVLTVAIVLVTPWDGKYRPEGNWMFGPMWLLVDWPPGMKLVGAAIAAVMLWGIGSVLVRPNTKNVVIAWITLHAWVGVGFALAMFATVQNN